MKKTHFATAALLAASFATAACSKHDDAGNVAAADNATSELGSANNAALANSDLGTNELAPDNAAEAGNIQ
jgi:hypothetical protein